MSEICASCGSEEKEIIFVIKAVGSESNSHEFEMNLCSECVIALKNKIDLCLEKQLKINSKIEKSEGENINEKGATSKSL